MKTRVKKILYAADFSDFSRKVLNYAVALAGYLNARLIIFHSACLPRHQIHGNVYQNPGARAALFNKARLRIEKLMEGRGADWTPIIAMGDPVEEAAKASEHEDADLIIAASHEIKGIKRILLGTVVERMARRMTRPLLVVNTRGVERLGGVFQMKKIVLSCGLLDNANPMIPLSLVLAREFNARLHLFHAIESPVDEELMDTTSLTYAEIQERKVNRKKKQLLELLPRESPGEPEVKAVSLPGIPGEELCLYARKTDADLIVVGVRNHSSFGKLVIGSTTEAALRRAPCPVLVIPNGWELNGKGTKKS